MVQKYRTVDDILDTYRTDDQARGGFGSDPVIAGVNIEQLARELDANDADIQF